MMKKTILIFTAFALLFMTACEKEEEFPDHEAHIRFVNHTNMVFDSVVNEYYCVVGCGFFHQKYIDLYPLDTSEYQSGNNIEGNLEIFAYTQDTNYYYKWIYPSTHAIDPFYAKDALFLDEGFYTFGLYKAGGQSNTLYAGLISYSMH
ncbi:MAG: hypothetical protein ACP5DZ_05125 [Bacteroidales bacterium]